MNMTRSFCKSLPILTNNLQQMSRMHFALHLIVANFSFFRLLVFNITPLPIYYRRNLLNLQAYTIKQFIKQLIFVNLLMGTESSIFSNTQTSILSNSFNSNSNNNNSLHSEIYASFVVSKQFQLSNLKIFIQQRSSFVDLNQHICGVKGYQLKEYQPNAIIETDKNLQKQTKKEIIDCAYNFQCQEKMHVFVYYEKFNDYLININQKKWSPNLITEKNSQNSRQIYQIPLANNNQQNSRQSTQTPKSNHPPFYKNLSYQAQQNQSRISYYYQFNSSQQNQSQISYNYQHNNSLRNNVISIGWSQAELYYFIYCISDALQFLKNQHPPIHHGDISLKTICKVGVRYKLIDTYFLYGGISAYERILQGEPAFISPQQMLELRSGYSRQSPAIQQSNDIFALGMTLLEMMTGKQSKECYKQSYLRFQTVVLQSRLQFLRRNSIKSTVNMKHSNRSYDPFRRQNYQTNKNPCYSTKLIRILERMLQMDPEKRISLKQIVKQGQIAAFLLNKGKISMKSITFL